MRVINAPRRTCLAVQGGYESGNAPLGLIRTRRRRPPNAAPSSCAWASSDPAAGRPARAFDLGGRARARGGGRHTTPSAAAAAARARLLLVTAFAARAYPALTAGGLVGRIADADLRATDGQQ